MKLLQSSDATEVKYVLPEVGGGGSLSSAQMKCGFSSACLQQRLLNLITHWWKVGENIQMQRLNQPYGNNRMHSSLDVASKAEFVPEYTR